MWNAEKINQHSFLFKKVFSNQEAGKTKTETPEIRNGVY